MKHVEHHIIKPKDPLYPICEAQSRAVNNLINAGRFRQRNLATGLQKKPEDRHELENQVIEEMKLGVAYYNKHARPDNDGNPKHMTELTSTEWYASCALINAMMMATKNPDYYADAITVQTAQATLKQLDESWHASIDQLKDYAANPGKYSGRPGLAGYRKKGGLATVVQNNQDAVIYEKKAPKKKKGQKTPKFKPGWELKIGRGMGNRLDLGNHRPVGNLSEIRIVPLHNCFDIQIVTDDGVDPAELSKMDRVMCGDIGVDNLITLVSNCGVPKTIYKGAVLKSVNQWYNKEMARIASEQTKGGDKKFVMTDEAYRVTKYRNNRVRDILLKVSKQIVDECVENRIDTLIVGYNQGWKNEVSMGHKNNQEFVQIPFSCFLNYLEDRCKKASIRFVKREESYTSQACFDAGDFIPVYGEDEKPADGYEFSGYRRPTTTYWRRNDDGELEPYKVQPRGLYRVRDGNYDVNSDANGAANTLRKEWPGAFDGEGHCVPNLRDGEVRIIVHPDYENGKKLRDRQLSENKNKPMSNARRKRLERKLLVQLDDSSSSPSGIEAL